MRMLQNIIATGRCGGGRAHGVAEPAGLRTAPTGHRNTLRGRRPTAAGAALLGALACSLACTQLPAQSPLPVESIKLPPGFAIEVVARVPNARAMTWGSAGTLFVGSAGEGSVYAVKLPPPGAKGEGVVSKIASGLREPA